MTTDEAKRIFDSMRFQKKYIPEPNSGCWLWLGALGSSGSRGIFYPRIRVGKKISPAHAIACTAVNGERPSAKDEPDHICLNPQCVNPSHLEWVSHRENVRRGRSIFSENMRKTHCLNGHEFTKENTWVEKNGFRHCTKCRTAAYKKWYDANYKAYAARKRSLSLPAA